VARDTEGAERLELALIENVAREDLNAVEEARACATLVEDLGITKEELGRRVGKSRVAVSNLIRLLALPDDVLERLERGELSEGHGRAVLMAQDHETRRELAREAVERDWSVRETERRAKASEGRPTERRKPRIALHPDLADAIGAAEDALTAALGRDVRIRPARDQLRVEFTLEHPREGVDLAERILRQNAA
jgi:ParB family chromosome partitioning protein